MLSFTLVIRILCRAWTVDDVRTHRRDALEFNQLPFEIPSERVGRDHNVGEAIRKRDAVTKSIDNVDVLVTTGSCAFPYESA